MIDREDKEKRIKSFLKDLKKISMKHGVAIETKKPPYALHIRQNITYIVNPKTKTVFPVWLNDSKDPVL